MKAYRSLSGAVLLVGTLALTIPVSVVGLSAQSQLQVAQADAQSTTGNRARPAVKKQVKKKKEVTRERDVRGKKAAVTKRRPGDGIREETDY